MRIIDLRNRQGKSISILVVSDIHSEITESERKDISFINPDVCLFLGDICVQDIKTIVSLLPSSCLLYGILGNHDTPDVFEKAAAPVVNINGVCTQLGESNLSIAGIEGSHRYKSAPVVMHTHEESIEIARKLIAADILVAHDSMYGKYSKDDNKCGLKGITEYLNKKHPTLFVFGHHHIEDDFVYRHGFHKTRCICNNRFMAVNI